MKSGDLYYYDDTWNELANSYFLVVNVQVRRNFYGRYVVDGLIFRKDKQKIKMGKGYIFSANSSEKFLVSTTPKNEIN